MTDRRFSRPQHPNPSGTLDDRIDGVMLSMIEIEQFKKDADQLHKC